MKEYEVILSFTGEYEAVVEAKNKRDAIEKIIHDLYVSTIDDCSYITVTESEVNTNE